MLEMASMNEKKRTTILLAISRRRSSVPECLANIFFLIWGLLRIRRYCYVLRMRRVLEKGLGGGVLLHKFGGRVLISRLRTQS